MRLRLYTFYAHFRSLKQLIPSVFKHDTGVLVLLLLLKRLLICVVCNINDFNGSVSELIILRSSSMKFFADQLNFSQSNFSVLNLFDGYLPLAQ